MTRRRKTHREAAVKIIRVLRQAGHIAYLAGGCVRDDWLGAEPKDFDVATDANPDEVKGLFARSRFVGEAFGVARVQLYGYATEVATFRTEWGYEDGRRPTQVHFSNAQDDAQRRDFTINGLFEDPLAQDPDQRFIDYVDGRRDLEAGVIRAIGDPDQRFAEDYLRMLRAVRFASRLGFEIEPMTAGAIREHAPRLSTISRERIGQEVMWMLTSRDPSQKSTKTLPSGKQASLKKSSPDTKWTQAILLLQKLGLDGPVLNEDSADFDLPTVSQLQGGDYTTVLAAWILDRYFPAYPVEVVNRQPDNNSCDEMDARLALIATLEQFVRNSLRGIVQQWRVALCLSNRHDDALQKTIELLPVALRWPQLDRAQRKRLLARPNWDQAAALLQASAHHPGVADRINQVQADAAPLLAEGVNPQHWITGYDLIKMGYEPGPGFKALLDEVYDAQLDGRVTSREQALAWLRLKTKRNR